MFNDSSGSESEYSDFDENIDVEDVLEESLNDCEGFEGTPSGVTDNIVEVMDMDEDSDQESLTDNVTKKEVFQKDLWQMRLFPYAEDMAKNADEHFSYIKTGLARAVLHRDTRPGLIYYAQELAKFLNFYGRRFTKRDHIAMIELLYSILLADKLDFSVVQVIARILSQLLCRKNLISQEELVLDWKPLYKLYYEISYKNLEEEGILLLPEDLKKSLEKLIQHARTYFAKEATQEILDEIRPMFCPFDDIFSRGLSLAFYFLPTCLTAEQHAEYGASLWVDEFWHFFAEMDSSVHGETLFIKIFGKLAKDSPFYYDWTDKLDILFGDLLRSLKLNVSVEQVSLWTSTNVFSTIPSLLVYNLAGDQNPVQSHLDKLFRMLHNYFHPSNSGGHTQHLIMFILLMATEMANRLQRERHNPKRHLIKVPQQFHLTNKQCDDFVRSVLPCLEFAAYSKTKSEFCPAIFRVLSFLSPGQVIPCVLDLVYPSLETVVEPHRLMQSLNILTGICIQLTRDDPVTTGGERRALRNFEASSTDSHLKSFRIHAIYLLERLLPAIDLNDAVKTTLSIQIIGLLLVLIPVSDCSEAVYLRDDLTEEEKELCAATARFDGIVDSLLGKLFSMIEIFGTNPANNTRQNLTKLTKKNIEEIVMEKGIIAIIKTLLKNCSLNIYNKVFTFYFDYLQRAMTDSKPVLDTMRCLIPVFILNDPEKAFPVLFDYVFGKLKSLITEEILLEEEVETSVVWFLTLFAEVVHEIPGKYLMARRQEIDSLIDFGLRFKCKDSINLVGRIIQNCLSSLVAFYPKSAAFERRKKTDLTEYLPIRNWAKSVDKHTWQMNWQLPEESEIQYAQHLVNKIIFHELDKLVQPSEIDKLSHNDLQKRLIFVRCALSGASKLLPFLPGEPVQQFPLEPAGVCIETVFVPKSMRILTSTDGRNLRLAIFERLKVLADYILTNRTDDTKSMIECVSILRVLLLVRGVDEKTVQPLMTAYRMNKQNLLDPVRGSSANIEAVVEDSLIFMHLKRSINKPSLSLNQIHLEAFRLLIRFSTSMYSTVRTPAQRVLDGGFSSYARSYKFVLEDIIQYIHKDSNATHEQLKGALHILSIGKHRSIALRQDFKTLLRIWPTLVNSKYSEKPSIVTLQDQIHDLLIGLFASFEIQFTFTDETIFQRARALLEDYDGCVHSPKYPSFDYLSADEARSLEIKRNQDNVNSYYELCNKLISLCHDSTLHWRQTELAQSLLSLLLRRDIEYPKKAILIYARLLSSDVIKMRKTAIHIMSSWLKINKPKTKRQVFDVDKGVNKPGARWPINYGIRKDNVGLLFKQEDKIVNADQWDSSFFHTKPYVGFYIWPKEYKGYAPPSLQSNLNRDASAFSETERELITLLIEPKHLARILKLMAVEETKGGEEFGSASYMLFSGLTRSFSTVIVDALRPFVEELLTNKQESSQRLASEVVAGIIKGSKLWTYNKVKPLRDWLGPLLIANFETMNVEIEGLWAQALVSIFFDSEPRQTAWLLELLFELWKKPNENVYHTSVRLYYLHCSISQWQWRILEQWNTLFDICKPMIGQSLQNLRSRVAAVFADACQFENLAVLPSLEPRFKPIHFKTVSDMVKGKIQKMFINSLEGANSSISNSESDTEMIDLTDNKKGALSNTKGELAVKREKLVFLTYLSSLSVYSACSAETYILQFLPVLAHYANDTKDEELRNQCSLLMMHVLSVIPVKKSNLAVFLQTVNESLHRCSWWKARVTLLRFMQVSVFANMYLLTDHVREICELLFYLMKDPQLEVRLAASDTISGFINCGFIPVEQQLMDVAYKLTESNEVLEKHSGVLALSAIILAFPYTVPDFVPDVLMNFCRFGSFKQPIHATVKKTLSEFKRTHMDCWHEHKQEFSEDQLAVLTGLLISPNYYV